jgi:hypothetical protein
MKMDLHQLSFCVSYVVPHVRDVMDTCSYSDLTRLGVGSIKL